MLWFETVNAISLFTFRQLWLRNSFSPTQVITRYDKAVHYCQESQDIWVWKSLKLIIYITVTPRYDIPLYNIVPKMPVAALWHNFDWPWLCVVLYVNLEPPKPPSQAVPTGGVAQNEKIESIVNWCFLKDYGKYNESSYYHEIFISRTSYYLH